MNTCNRINFSQSNIPFQVYICNKNSFVLHVYSSFRFIQINSSASCINHVCATISPITNKFMDRARECYKQKDFFYNKTHFSAFPVLCFYLMEIFICCTYRIVLIKNMDAWGN